MYGCFLPPILSTDCKRCFLYANIRICCTPFGRDCIVKTFLCYFGSPLLTFFFSSFCFRLPDILTRHLRRAPRPESTVQPNNSFTLFFGLSLDCFDCSVLLRQYLQPGTYNFIQRISRSLHQRLFLNLLALTTDLPTYDLSMLDMNILTCLVRSEHCFCCEGSS